MGSRGALQKATYEDSLEDVLPICTPAASDSAILDNVVEFLVQNGRSFTKTLSMLVPEPWENREDMSPELRAYYRYQAYHGAMGWSGLYWFANANTIGAKLDKTA